MPSALSPPPWASSWLDDVAPRDRVLVDAYCLPLWIASHSILVSLGGTVRTRGAGFDAETIGSCSMCCDPASFTLALPRLTHFTPPLSRQLCRQHSGTIDWCSCAVDRSPPPSAPAPNLRDPVAPPGRGASPHSSPRRRCNALAPNGLPYACERGHNAAGLLITDSPCVLRRTSDPPVRLTSDAFPEYCRRAHLSASIRATSLEIIAPLPAIIVTMPKLVNNGRLHQAIINGALRFYGPSNLRPGVVALFDFKPVERFAARCCRAITKMSIETIASILIQPQIWSITDDFVGWPTPSSSDRRPSLGASRTVPKRPDPLPTHRYTSIRGTCIEIIATRYYRFCLEPWSVCGSLVTLPVSCYCSTLPHKSAAGLTSNQRCRTSLQISRRRSDRLQTSHEFASSGLQKSSPLLASSHVIDFDEPDDLLVQDWTLRKCLVPRGSESAEAMLEAIDQVVRARSAHDPLQTRRIQQSSSTNFKSPSPRKPNIDPSTGRGGSAERAVQARNLSPNSELYGASNRPKLKLASKPNISVRALAVAAADVPPPALAAAASAAPCANPASAAAAPARERRSQRIRALPRPITRCALRRLRGERPSDERRALRAGTPGAALRIRAPAPLSPPRAGQGRTRATRVKRGTALRARRAPFADSTPLGPRDRRRARPRFERPSIRGRATSAADGEVVPGARAALSSTRRAGPDPRDTRRAVLRRFAKSGGRRSRTVPARDSTLLGPRDR
ncbi:hypothetical protein B0H15DRAFT_1019768, partial [Mycena belliarum]